MKSGYITIQKIDYTKKPMFHWTYHNAMGGSFSNSGKHRSLIACANHAWANLNINGNADVPVRVVTVHGFDASDKPVETTYETILLKLMDKRLLCE